MDKLSARLIKKKSEGAPINKMRKGPRLYWTILSHPLSVV